MTKSIRMPKDAISMIYLEMPPKIADLIIEERGSNEICDGRFQSFKDEDP